MGYTKVPGSSEQNLGSSPVATSPLMVNDAGADTSADAASNADDLILGDNSSATTSGMTILSTSQGFVKFGDAASDGAGIIEYNHASGFMRFGIEGANEWVINAGALYPQTDNGNSIGTASLRPSDLHVMAATVYGTAIIDPAGDAVSGDAAGTADELLLGSLTATDSGLTILTSTSGAGHIVATDSAGAIQQEIRFDQVGNSMLFATGGTDRVRVSSSSFRPQTDSALTSGEATRRWSDIHTMAVSLRTPSGFAGTAREDNTVALRSTDGSNNDTTVGTLDADGEHGKLTYHVVGMDESGANVYSRCEVTSYYRSGGTVTQVTAHMADSQTVGTVTGWAIFEQISGDNILLRLRGATSTDIRWSGWYTWQAGGTEAS